MTEENKSFRGIETGPIEKDKKIIGHHFYEYTKDYFGVKTGEDILCIKELQLEGKKRMDTKAFLSGVKLSQNDILGTFL